jgi:hypothetical protein
MFDSLKQEAIGPPETWYCFSLIKDAIDGIVHALELSLHSSFSVPILCEEDYIGIGGPPSAHQTMLLASFNRSGESIAL